MRILLNVFARLESIIRECCIFIRELDYANARLSSPSDKKVTTLRKGTSANMQQRSSAAVGI
jgi:hypothetical protein